MNLTATRCVFYSRFPIRHLQLLNRHIRTLLGHYLGGTLFLLATNAFALLIPWFMKLAVEGLQHPASARYSPAGCAAIIVLLAVGHCVTRIFSRTLMLNAARLIEFRIREDLFRRLLVLDIPFFSGSRTGDILSRFANDLTNVRMLTGFGIMSALNALILYMATLALLVRINPWLTFCTIVPFPLMVLLVKRVSSHMFQRSIETQEALARLTSLAEESVSAVRMIRSYCREEHFEGLFGKTREQYLESSMGLARLRGLILPVMASATGASTLILLFLGGRLVMSHAITLGDFVAFSGYLAMLVWPTVMLGWILTLAQRGAASMSRLAEILEAEPGVVDREGAVTLGRVGQGIELKGVTFAYGQTRVLDGISLQIAAGERVGITGGVGSGKSTLLRLIPRLLPVGDGQILIDGHDVNRISLASLRARIGYVPQEAFLFSRSIRDNIAYGAGEGDVAQAARQAGFMEDVELFQEGLETMIGEKGVALSGGQKQRLSIARALLAEPDVLLLDDPISAVDAGREEEILAGLRTFWQGRTVLIVSHRLSAFRDCDRVVVLKEGRIAEQGPPDELLARGGLYAEMHRLQQLEGEKA